MDYINAMATKRARHERHKERERRPAKRLASAESESSDVEASRCAVGASNIVLLPSHSHAHKDSRDCEGDVHFGQGRHSLSHHSPTLVGWVHPPRGCCCLEPRAMSASLPCSGPYGPTLAEFKAALGRKGHFKYFFKAMEEETSVKVEVTDEAALLPSAGGKYVAWLTTLQ